MAYRSKSKVKPPTKGEFPNPASIRKSSDPFAKYWFDIAMQINHHSWLASLWDHFYAKGFTTEKHRFAGYKPPDESWMWAQARGSAPYNTTSDTAVATISKEERIARLRSILQVEHPDRGGDTAKFILAMRQLDSLRRKK